jgi:ATP-dependent 26S proteasome regulatory subunit
MRPGRLDRKIGMKKKQHDSSKQKNFWI